MTTQPSNAAASCLSQQATASAPGLAGGASMRSPLGGVGIPNPDEAGSIPARRAVRKPSSPRRADSREQTGTSSMLETRDPPSAPVEHASTRTSQLQLTRKGTVPYADNRDESGKTPGVARDRIRGSENVATETRPKPGVARVKAEDVTAGETASISAQQPGLADPQVAGSVAGASICRQCGGPRLSIGRFIRCRPCHARKQRERTQRAAAARTHCKTCGGPLTLDRRGCKSCQPCRAATLLKYRRIGGRPPKQWMRARDLAVEMGILTRKDVAQVCKLSRETAGRMLALWGQQGRLIALDKGVYTLPETRERARLEEHRENAILAHIEALETEAAQ